MDRLIIIAYEIALWLIALAALPKILYQFFVHKKYRNSLLARLGCKIPPIVKDNRPLVWIHAVSVGETKAVVGLAREVKKTLKDCLIIVSSITETGHAEAKRSLPFANHHVYLPLDFSFLTKKMLKKASPDLVILCESDFWYNFLRLSKKQGAKVVLVNGKMSKRSENRFAQFSFFSRRVFHVFDALCLQNSLYQQRFLNSGACQQKIAITGNLKLDEEYPHLTGEEIIQWKKRLGILKEHLVLTVGSTHAPEEQLLLSILKDIWKTHPQLKVVLVPRHPERFKEVASLLKREKVTFVSFTEISRCTGQEKVLLIDAMGMLRMCYQLADITLVGGSYTTKVGGHNILEPCWYEKPVLFGPYMHTQHELVDLIKQFGAGLQVDENYLKQQLEDWLSNPSERENIGKKGSILIKNLKGSTEKTLNVLSPFLLKK